MSKIDKKHEATKKIFDDWVEHISGHFLELDEENKIAIAIIECATKLTVSEGYMIGVLGDEK